MTKKGQVTIFIILGILILLAGVVFFFMRGETIEQQIDTSAYTSQIVPIEFNPVDVFVENCLTETAIQGLEILGERGGFIEPYRYGFSSDPSDVTSGNAIMMASNWMIPYWWYLSSDNECTGDCNFVIVPESKLFLYKSSGTPSIEGQMEEYINDHLNECINNFVVLEKQGYDINELGSPSSIVRVKDGFVQFLLDYPIEASKLSRREISKFVTTVDVDLVKIYEFSSLLVTMEANYHFLDNYVMDLIVGFSGVNRNKLPPITGLEFDFDSVRWSKTWVGDRLLDLLTSYISLLRVYGTENYKDFNIPGNQFKEDFYNAQTVLLGNLSYSDLSIDFDYLGWKPYFDLNCDGDECRGDSFMTELMSLFGVQRYNAVYDLSFPAMITIKDKEAVMFGDEGYSFTFLLEGNIRNNKPLDTDYVQINVSSSDTGSMLCDSNKRNSGLISLEVKDLLDEKPVADAKVLYSCAGETCNLGRTSSNGTLETKYPVCFNGIVSVIDEDHVDYSKILTTQPDKPDHISIKMSPIVTKNYTIKKSVVRKNAMGNFEIDASTIANPLNLSMYERAMITLSRRSETGESSFASFVEFDANRSYGTIDIAPGEYDMKIDVYYYGDLIIPKRVEDYSGEKVEYPEIIFNETNPLPNGGLHCDTDTTYIKNSFSTRSFIFEEDGMIVFKILSPDIPNIPEGSRLIEDLEQIGMLDDNSYTQYCYALSPTIENE